MSIQLVSRQRQHEVLALSATVRTLSRIAGILVVPDRSGAEHANASSDLNRGQAEWCEIQPRRLLRLRDNDNGARW